MHAWVGYRRYSAFRFLFLFLACYHAVPYFFLAFASCICPRICLSTVCIVFLRFFYLAKSSSISKLQLFTVTRKHDDVQRCDHVTWNSIYVRHILTVAVPVHISAESVTIFSVCIYQHSRTALSYLHHTASKHVSSPPGLQCTRSRNRCGQFIQHYSITSVLTCSVRRSR